MKRLLLAVLFPVALHAQSIVATQIKLEPQATHFLDSLALDAREHRTENAGCITEYSIKDSLLTITTISAATYEKADSVSVSVRGWPGVCPLGVPAIHSHVAWGGLGLPSDTDMNTGKLRGIWSALLQVRTNGYLLFLY